MCIHAALRGYIQLAIAQCRKEGKVKLHGWRCVKTNNIAQVRSPKSTHVVKPIYADRTVKLYGIPGRTCTTAASRSSMLSMKRRGTFSIGRRTARPALTRRGPLGCCMKAHASGMSVCICVFMVTLRTYKDIYIYIYIHIIFHIYICISHLSHSHTLSIIHINAFIYIYIYIHIYIMYIYICVCTDIHTCRRNCIHGRTCT